MPALPTVKCVGGQGGEAARGSKGHCRHTSNFGSLRLCKKVRDFPIVSDALLGGVGRYGGDRSGGDPSLVLAAEVRLSAALVAEEITETGAQFWYM